MSYSLYLIHWVVILAIFHAFGGPLTLPGLASVLVLAAVAAEIMCRLIEAPSIRFGRWLTRRQPASPLLGNELMQGELTAGGVSSMSHSNVPVLRSTR